MSKQINFKSIEIDGIDRRDYPDFCDAFISYAEYEDGTELSESELDELTENMGDYINERACLIACGGVKMRIPEAGEIIKVGVPSVGLASYEFISVTAKGKFLHWNETKTRAIVTDPEFCYQAKEKEKETFSVGKNQLEKAYNSTVRLAVWEYEAGNYEDSNAIFQEALELAEVGSFIIGESVQKIIDKVIEICND